MDLRHFDVMASPPRLRAARDGSPCGVLVTPDRSVVATRSGPGTSSLGLFDLSRPDAPRALGAAAHRGDADHAAIVGDALLVSNADALVAFPLACE